MCSSNLLFQSIYNYFILLEDIYDRDMAGVIIVAGVSPILANVALLVTVFIGKSLHAKFRATRISKNK